MENHHGEISVEEVLNPFGELRPTFLGVRDWEKKIKVGRVHC